jgi:hypothetical protein|tara:strand:+ start:709 stop:1302 length:594 start_codon:yes stop_codon:yes gene_type:complete
MPYTKEELSNVGFYNNFIDKLRSEYLSQLVNRALNFFRDENNVLYSFEDISTSLGIEDAVLNNNPQYSTLETELSRTTIEEQTGYTDFKELLETESCSLQSQPLNKTIKNRNSEKLIDRSITELIKVEIADPLPENLENGDTITTNNPNDPRKWLIDGNQKRPFPDLQSFYAFEGDWKQVKTLSDDIIDSIPEGEPV